MFSFPFRKEKKKRKKKEGSQEAGSPGYPYLVPEVTDVYSRVNNAKVTEG